MTKINIIPEKVPNRLWNRTQYETIILYALGIYGPMKREEFINNKEKGIHNRMNKNTFHKWAKKLKIKNQISVSREEKQSIYTITNLGVKVLLKKLKSYNLDVKTILNLERKTSSKTITLDTKFLKNFGIENKDIMIEFLKLKNEITRDKLKLFSEEKYNRAILFLTLNHPRYYDRFGKINISIDEFVDKYGNDVLSKDDLKWFLHKLNTKKTTNISFYKLKLEKKRIDLYFRASEEYGSIFETTIKSILRDHYYLQYLHKNKFQEIIINEVCEDAITILINKYNFFHKDLKASLYDTTKYYLLILLKALKKKPFIKSFNLYEIPTLILTSEIFDFERLDYLQKRALFHLEEAYNAQVPSQYRNNMKYAIKFIEKAMESDKNDPYNYAIKAQILHSTGDYIGALKAIYKAIKLDPQEANYYSDYAFFLSWQNKYEEALNAINKAIELDPYNAEHYSSSSSVYSSLNQYEKALEALNLAIKNDPMTVRYYIEKANCLAHELKKHKSALRVIENAFNLNPKKLELFELYKIKAGILLSMKDREEALNIIRKTRQLYPNKKIYPNLH
ncbi:MAG: tetratricopeptide repeat protein [Candidatus Thorarchaeota archaeon]